MRGEAVRETARPERRALSAVPLSTRRRSRQPPATPTGTPEVLLDQQDSEPRARPSSHRPRRDEARGDVARVRGWRAKALRTSRGGAACSDRPPSWPPRWRRSISPAPARAPRAPATIACSTSMRASLSRSLRRARSRRAALQRLLDRASAHESRESMPALTRGQSPRCELSASSRARRCALQVAEAE